MDPLKNPKAEKCAQDIAAVIDDKVKRQAIFSAFVEAHPKLKHWEGQAIGNRAVFIARESALAAIDKGLAANK